MSTAAIFGPGVRVPEEMLPPASSMGARRAGIRLLYNGTDITQDIAPWCLGVDFTDSIEQADDLQVKLFDDGRWTDAWAPEFGAQLKAELIIEELGKRESAPLGVFTIDEIASSGPPRKASIKAVSADVSTNVRREEKTRAWENVSVRGIAETIAKNGGLSLMYLAAVNPTYTRKDQVKLSDLDFLVQLATREGLRVKVSDGKLIVIGQADIDSLPTSAGFYPGDGRLISWDFKCGISNSYAAAIVAYQDPATKKLLEYRYAVPNAPKTGQTYRVKRRCESLAEAQRVAVNEVARMNRWGQTGTIIVTGDARIAATSNIELLGLGSLIDGVWSVEEMGQKLWPHTTELKLVKAATQGIA